MHQHESIPIIENIFHITLVKNPGAAFGIFQGQTMFLVVVTIAIIFLLVGVYWKLARQNTILTIGLALQAGGAAGNLIDRIRFSYVVDFFDFRIWPVFNIADIAIVVGAIIIAWQILVWPDEDKSQSTNHKVQIEPLETINCKTEVGKEEQETEVGKEEQDGKI